MNLDNLLKRAKEIQSKYRELNTKNGHKIWGASEYTQGLVGDVGDLMKYIMAHEKLRTVENYDKKLGHELADCLWSILLIADQLGINLEEEFMKNMNELEERISKE